MNKTIGILGTNRKLSTIFVEKLILKTRANIDQEHIPMNIVINNKLLEKTESEIKDILDKFAKNDTNYLILTFNDINVYNIIKRNTNIPILNNSFDINDELFIKKIIELTGREVIK